MSGSVPVNGVEDHGSHTAIKDQSPRDDGGTPEAVLLLQESDGEGHYHLADAHTGRHDGICYVSPSVEVVGNYHV